MEQPDLQMESCLWGIEVTTARSDKDKISGEFVKYRNGFDKEKCKSKIEKCGGALDDRSVSYPPITFAEEKKMIEESFLKKLSKVQLYKKRMFANLGLVILRQEPLVPAPDILEQ